MSGYFKRPDLTAAAFRDGWFRTGDHGSIDEQGRIWVTGRLKDEINRGGFKVQPAEIDSLLEGHPAVAEACVFGIPDPMGGEAVAPLSVWRKARTQPLLACRLGARSGCARQPCPSIGSLFRKFPAPARGKVSRIVVRRALTQNTNVQTLNPNRRSPQPPRSGLRQPSFWIRSCLFCGLDCRRLGCPLMFSWRRIFDRFENCFHRQGCSRKTRTASM